MKTGNENPSRDEWKSLYDATEAFKSIRPWGWMEDADLFGVQNPEDGEIGYCCVLGAAGEVFGLSVYLGAEGLTTYRDIVSGEIGMGNEDILFTQKALTAFLEDREEIEKEDLKIIKDLGLKFRGRNAWPQFRSHLPGYVPWHLNSEQVRFLTLALEQAVEVADRLRENPELLEDEGEDRIFVRVPEKGEGRLFWKDAWITPQAWEKPMVTVPPVDEVRLRRIASHSKKGLGAWELDTFHFPNPVAEGERPYFPCLSIVVDRGAGLILGSWLKSPWERYSDLYEEVLGLMEKGKTLPRTIRVCRKEIFDLLKPITSALKIGLNQVESLEGVEGFRQALVNEMF